MKLNFGFTKIILILIGSLLNILQGFTSDKQLIMLTNANIYANENASIIVIDDGKIKFIGNKIGAAKYVALSPLIWDMRNSYVSPGFIDNHNHVFEAASEIGADCELGKYANLLEQIDFLEACKVNALPNQWVIG
ncbi:MAG: hypothetical protein HRU28_12910 [Rhizobiales bacterium]|nr:hypothetical protein [Hyphomicrobiales bacterium]